MRTREMPVYRQTSDFSCGAASLVMALHALRGEPATKRREWELWRQATMIGIPGIDQWGLALAARQSGVPATVVSAAEMTFPYKGRRPGWASPDMVDLTVFAQQENHARALQLQVTFQQRAPTPQDVTGALQHGAVPVLLVDLHILSRGQDMAPHWVVVAGNDAGTFTIHDPAPEGPGVHTLDLQEMWACLDVSRYSAQPTVVLLGP